MASRTAYLYELPTSGLRVRALPYLLDTVRASLCHPAHGQVVRIDEVGEHVLRPIADFERELEAEESVSFEVWFDHSEDLYVRVRTIGADLHVTEFGMEGTSELQRLRLKTYLVTYFRRIHQEGRSVGLIYDPVGASEDYDWDALFHANSNEPNELMDYEWPELVMVGPSHFASFTRRPHQMHEGLLSCGAQFGVR